MFVPFAREKCTAGLLCLVYLFALLDSVYVRECARALAHFQCFPALVLKLRRRYSGGYVNSFTVLKGLGCFAENMERTLS